MADSNQASGTDAAFGEASNLPETLHVAARTGSVESVNMLLRHKADPMTLDSDGLTALQVAEAAGKSDVADVLRQVTPSGNAQDNSPASRTSPKSRTLSPKAGAHDNMPASPGAASEPQLGVEIEEDVQMGGGDGDDEDYAPAQSPNASGRVSPKSGVGDYKDLKSRTAFPDNPPTTDGVKKGTTFMANFSGFHRAPRYSLGARTTSMFLRSSSTPAPGSYNLPHEEKSKFKTTPQFSFGGGSRFGLGISPTKMQPGPGQYNPKDPTLHVDTKVGFGTSIRAKSNPAAQANPGPGAYESKNGVGGGLMFTARGRHPTSYMRSRSMPGPGAYSPTTQGVFQASPKCGFGTSTRGEFGTKSRMAAQPGPGAYELQNFKCMGKDSVKYSATSRRRMHDLNSYVTPGPGTYNAHVTSFGDEFAPQQKTI